MGKKMTRAGMVLRRNIRADVDAEPAIDHLKIRSKYKVGEPIVESAIVMTLSEWDALIDATPDNPPVSKEERPKAVIRLLVTNAGSIYTPTVTRDILPGIEQGVIKFTRKPAKMGTDYIFWVPRVYVKNGLVDPTIEYEVYLKKR